MMNTTRDAEVALMLTEMSMALSNLQRSADVA